MRILEAYSCPKTGINGLNGDSLYHDSNFIGVIDGATPKNGTMWDNLPTDVFISRVIVEAISQLPVSSSANEAFALINDKINASILSAVHELYPLDTSEVPQASVAIFSVSRKEIWRLGDCPILLNGVENRATKKVDVILSRLRALAAAIDAARIEEGSEPLWPNDSREAILPFLEQQHWLANKASDFGYGVLNGDPRALNYLEIIPVRTNDSVVLATDGYPKLFGTLKECEEFLSETLEKDPCCLSTNRNTKGLIRGNNSYDDRTFISFLV